MVHAYLGLKPKCRGQRLTRRTIGYKALQQSKHFHRVLQCTVLDLLDSCGTAPLWGSKIAVYKCSACSDTYIHFCTGIVSPRASALWFSKNSLLAKSSADCSHLHYQPFWFSFSLCTVPLPLSSALHSPLLLPLPLPLPGRMQRYHFALILYYWWHDADVICRIFCMYLTNPGPCTSVCVWDFYISMMEDLLMQLSTRSQWTCY